MPIQCAIRSPVYTVNLLLGQDGAASTTCSQINNANNQRVYVHERCILSHQESKSDFVLLYIDVEYFSSGMQLKRFC